MSADYVVGEIGFGTNFGGDVGSDYAEGDGLRIAVKATSWARLVQERDQWRECAESLAPLARGFCAYLIDVGDDASEERDALAKFEKLKQ